MKMHGAEIRISIYCYIEIPGDISYRAVIRISIYCRVEISNRLYLFHYVRFKAYGSNPMHPYSSEKAK